ncbi:MAG: PD40 domain-containing protein, partial [Verrucomicrobia bacterium]|nr:PD40 domain-containing protein [Verrucomicrobiota bacterium]
ELQTGATDVISTNGPGNGDFTGPAISADGRFVAYTAISLVTSNANVFLWDAQTATNTLVSVNRTGTGPADGVSDSPAFSPDGQSLAFLSDASDLVTNPVDGNFHLYLRNLTTGVTQLIDVDRTGGAQGDLFEGGAFNGDGSLVAFESLDDQVVTNDFNEAFDVFVRNVTNGVTTLVSARDPGLPVLTANGSSVMAPNAVSADGRFAVFVSDATNLVAGDTNGVQDVFVYDLLAGTNLLVSVNTNGMSGDGVSSSPVISPDGRFVAFVSLATDLAPNDTNNLPDVYLRDLQAGTTTLISVNLSGVAAGVSATASPFYACAVSPDGRFVAFTSGASGIVSNTFPLTYNIFVRDVATGITVRVPPLNPSALSFPGQVLSPLSLSGSLFFSNPGDPLRFAYFDYPTGLSRVVGTNSLPPAVSANGRFLAYQVLSLTTNQVYVYDTATGSNTLVTSTSNLGFTSPTFIHRVSVSDDGRYVAFVCDAGNLVANDTNQAPDVFVADAHNPDQLTLVSVNQAGSGAGNAGSDSPVMSRDGRFVTFRSFATDLVAEPTDGQPNVYLRDLGTGTTVLLSGNRAGTASGNGRSSLPVMSADGATVFFSSDAPDLVAGDFNDFQDLFFWNNPATAGRAFPSIAGGTPTITWTTVPGLVYRVEYKNDLGDTNGWTALSGDVTASGSTASKNDPGTLGAAQRLYRVRLVP